MQTGNTATEAAQDVTGVHVGVGSDELASLATRVREGDRIEVTYKREGRERTLTGRVVDDGRDPRLDSVDLRIDAGGPQEAYLHVNTATGSYAFYDEFRKRTEYKVVDVRRWFDLTPAIRRAE